MWRGRSDALAYFRGVTALVVTSGEIFATALVADSRKWYREHWLLRCRIGRPVNVWRTSPTGMGWQRYWNS